MLRRPGPRTGTLTPGRELAGTARAGAAAPRAGGPSPETRQARRDRQDPLAILRKLDLRRKDQKAECMFQFREETRTRKHGSSASTSRMRGSVAFRGSCPKSRDEWHGDVQLKNTEVAAGIEQRGRATCAGPREGHVVLSPLWSCARSSKPSPQQFPAP